MRRTALLAFFAVLALAACAKKTSSLDAPAMPAGTGVLTTMSDEIQAQLTKQFLSLNSAFQGQLNGRLEVGRKELGDPWEYWKLGLVAYEGLDGDGYPMFTVTGKAQQLAKQASFDGPVLAQVTADQAGACAPAEDKGAVTCPYAFTVSYGGTQGGPFDGMELGSQTLQADVTYSPQEQSYALTDSSKNPIDDLKPTPTAFVLIALLGDATAQAASRQDLQNIIQGDTDTYNDNAARQTTAPAPEPAATTATPGPDCTPTLLPGESTSVRLRRLAACQ